MIERIVAAQNILALEFRGRVERAARAALSARGRCVIAVPGGSVAETFFPALVEADVSWTSVDVIWCDERVVPADDTASNAAVASRLWLRHLRPENAPSVHRMPVDTFPSERGAELYEGELDRVLGRSGGAIDLALVGMGPDGHVASLFPRHAAFTTQDERRVRAVHAAPKPPPDRLTLTLSALAQSRTVVLAAFGTEKASIVRDVLDGESTAPAAVLLRQCRSAVVMLDPAAASLLDAAP